MSWTDAVRNTQADEDAARVGTVALFTDASTELTGGSYARVVPAFSAAGVDGPLGVADQPATVGMAFAAPTFSVPGGVSVTHFGFFSGATLLGVWALPSPFTLAADGTQQVSVYTSAV